MLSEGGGWTEGVWTEGSYKSSTNSGKLISVSRTHRIWKAAEHSMGMEVTYLHEISCRHASIAAGELT